MRAAGATLRGLDLSAAWLHEADLSGADLRGSDLSAVDPRNVDLTGAQIDVTQAVVLVTTLGLASAPTPRSERPRRDTDPEQRRHGRTRRQECPACPSRPPRSTPT